MDFKLFFVVCLLQQFSISVLGQAHYMKIFKKFENGTSCIVIEDTFLPNYKGLEMEKTSEPVKIEVKPAVRLPEGGSENDEYAAVIVEIYGKNKEVIQQRLSTSCQTMVVPRSTRATDKRKPEVVKIVDSGDPHNRIDVVFMGDGYTIDERAKFFSDIDRFVEEMFQGVTFKSYLPLFNVWAIYVESPESGIGYDGPKNTPFKLYREKGQLRAVFTKNAKYAREVCKLTGQQACDYPSLMANDDYYGGLGGEFVIFTSSEQTGKIVLRHEMGHNFLEAGEEYDNGYAYFGANSDRSVDSVKWSRWLSGEKKEERAMYRILAYPWVDLQKKPWEYSFMSDGKYNRWQLTVSVTAAGHDDAVEFLMDGKPLPWNTTGVNDREFYNWAGTEGFSFGFHKLTVRSKTPSPNATVANMICSVALHEFGTEEEYHTDNNYVSAYPTWNFVRRKTYRPTNAGCLMRNMTHERFCPVCQEGMWINFLSYVSLIDNVTVSEEVEQTFEGTLGRRVSLQVLQLGQFRPAHQRIQGEKMEVTWFKNSVEQLDLKDQLSVLAPNGNWTVRVNFDTPEVRFDQYGVLRSIRYFEIL